MKTFGKTKEPPMAKKEERKDIDYVAMLGDLFAQYLEIAPQEEEIRLLILRIPFLYLKEKMAMELLCRFPSFRNTMFVFKNVPTLADGVIEIWKKDEVKRKKSKAALSEIFKLC